MPEPGTYTTIEAHVDDRGVATLTLARPEVQNAMNGQMYDEAREALRLFAADPAVRVLVLSNVGKTFCAGGDFKYQQSQADKPRGERIREAQKLALWLRELDTFPKLLIGRINGAAYAGGISLGFQEPAKLVEEAQSYVAMGYKALKLRIGDTVARDLERVRAVRKALGEGIDILTDANTNYTLADARNAYPGLDECRVGWLEEPFPSPDDRSYEIAAGYGRTPLAAGENHYTRFDFNRLIERKTINIFQPDLSKTGGITEGLRIAHMASAWKISIHPHTSVTGLNMAASLHFLAAIDNPGYFEADLSKGNVFRDQLCSPAYSVSADGTVTPPEAPGLGIEVDEAVLAAHPVIDGAGYV